MIKAMLKACRLAFAPALLMATGSMIMSCTAGGDPVEIEDSISSPRAKSSSSVSESSSSADTLSSSSESVNVDSLLDAYVDWVQVPATSLTESQVTLSVDAFEVSKTEVTQKLYGEIMDSLPAMVNMGDEIPVANLNWFEAVLFCNALSRKVGLDTAYIYDGSGAQGYLSNLTIDYSVESIRLPTETEWEIAYRAGTTTTYYWGTDVASKYAYYAQDNGPVKVAQYSPNGYGLYDMGGNVAEWTNDWFGKSPVKSTSNYTGPESGELKVVRGGGWNDKVKVLAADSTVKRDPLYASEMLGLRLVHSAGF